MTEKVESMRDKIKRWTVNDYFTPNIKAEVILDTLLTPYITEIIEDQMGTKVGKLTLLTKEMSIQEAGGKDDRGAKIDYVLEDEKKYIYLVELKTTNGSVYNSQVERYVKNCCDQISGTVKTFGEVIGDKLLSIIGKRYPLRAEGKRYPSAEPWLKDPVSAFQTVTAGCNGKLNEEKARDYLEKNGRASTYKYLYTMGQIMDHHPDTDSLKGLWNYPIRLIYLTPDGGNVFPIKPKRNDKQKQTEKELEWEKLRQDWEKLYLGPNGIESSVSLAAAGEYLGGKQKDELARLLSDIIKDIYGG